jgi:hypothetical protein
MSVSGLSGLSQSAEPLSVDTHTSAPGSGASTPLYGPYTADLLGTSLGTGMQTPGGSYFPGASPVEIILDNDNLVFRGQGGDMNPAYLSGRLELNLQESTNIKEINMVLTCKAKVHFSDVVG